MITFTEEAAKKALEIKAAESPPEQYLRVAVRGGGCSGFTYDLFFDDPKEIDRHFEFYGLKVVVDEMSLMYLMECTVEYKDSLMGGGFSFKNDAVSSVCGCGSSFSV